MLIIGVSITFCFDLTRPRVWGNANNELAKSNGRSGGVRQPFANFCELTCLNGKASWMRPSGKRTVEVDLVKTYMHKIHDQYKIERQ